MLRVGGWTAAAAAGVGLALIGGQNAYLRRRLLSRSDLLVGGSMSLLAGLLAGLRGKHSSCWCGPKWPRVSFSPVLLGGLLGGGLAIWRIRPDVAIVLRMAGVGAILGLVAALEFQQLLSAATPLRHPAVVPAWALLGGLLAEMAPRFSSRAGRPNRAYVGAAAGILAVGVVIFFEGRTGGVAPYLTDDSTRMIGWCVLGGALGRGMAWFVPNLSGGRTAAAGGVAGLVGAAVFALLDASVGGTTGRLAGAAALGFGIGLMVALAELACRDAWLEIDCGTREKRLVNLGRQAVSVGGGHATCRVSEQETMGGSLRYEVCDGRIMCEDVAAGRRFDVRPGDRREIGTVTVSVCGAIRGFKQCKHDGVGKDR
jgi:Ca-activated chloride channel family protein